MEELIVLVDEAGQPTGSAPKLASHHANTPLHLAFSAYVFNARGELLLTRRAETKKVFPGIWTNSCCGHPAPDEPMTDAITRRMKYELGLRPSSIRVALPNYRYKAVMRGIAENEICPVYIVDVTNEPKLNADEVAEYEWVTWKEFKRRIKTSPRKFSPWSKEQAKLLEPIIMNMNTSSAIEYISSYKKSLEAEMSKLLEQTSPPANYWQSDVRSRLSHYLSGGKLLRGCLLCFSHEIFGGTNPKAAKTAAASLELLHGALLIHDDIMDQDGMRRGKPALHNQYAELSADKDGAERFGENMAICAADAAIFIAMAALGSLKATEAQKAKLISLYGKVCETVCYGQMLDIELGHRDKLPTKKDILDVMEQKTAVYSLTLPLVAGAVLAGQSPSSIKMLEELGKYVGVIFQIRDDELGVFGDSSSTGKPVGSDIKEGKKTLLHYYLFKKCTQPQKKQLEKIFGNPNATEVDIEYVRNLMTELGVRSKINEEVSKFANEALGIINKLKVSKQHQQALNELVVFCANREL